MPLLFLVLVVIFAAAGLWAWLLEDNEEAAFVLLGVAAVWLLLFAVTA